MREWLPPDHPVWTVIAIVDRLETSAFHRNRRVGGVGRAGYDPDMLLTLLIWAWLSGVRSSRRIERACADVVSYRVICAGVGLITRRSRGFAPTTMGRAGSYSRRC